MNQYDTKKRDADTDAVGVPHDSLVQRLRAHDISPTHQRIEIARVLFARKEHFTAEQVLSRVNEVYVEASKATVYNTLKLFVEKNLIRELIVDPSRVVYDPNMVPHHHFHDTVSGMLTDIPGDEVRVLGLPSLPSGVVTEGVEIIVHTRPMDMQRVGDLSS